MPAPEKRRKKPSLPAELDRQKNPPFETHSLREGLTAFYSYPLPDAEGVPRPISFFKWGVYAFFDYDNEPIYVGQSYERVCGRIGRHLTNQRTDAVAMSVLDPFEVFSIEVWPLPQFQTINDKHPGYRAACDYLNALEHEILQRCLHQSKFKAVLNEKDPPPPKVKVAIPTSHRARVVSEEVYNLRSHPDTRIARRALIIARLAQVISERHIRGGGLRRVLLTQAKRLQWLAERRYIALGGPDQVEVHEKTEEE